MTKSQEVAADVAALLRARNPLLWVVTREEARVESYLMEAAASAGYVPYTWDCGQGVADLSGKLLERVGSPDCGDTLGAIKTAAANPMATNEVPLRYVWIMRDLPPWLVGSIGISTVRQLRNLARSLPGVPRKSAQAIIILSPNGDVPAELTNHATVIDWPLPDREEIAGLLDDAIDSLPEDMKTQAAPNGTRDAAIDAAVGLSGEEAQACYAKSLVQQRKIDPQAVAREKKRVIARERVLEWYDPLPGGLDAVGGLDQLKTWLVQRRLAYSPEARAYGLPAPKGALLAGIPGCLTGDTIINVSRKQRPGGFKGISLEALYYKFNNRWQEGYDLKLYGNSRPWDLNHPTKAHCYLEDQKYVGFNEIEGVVYSGVKEVFRLTTDHGTTIKATADHQFLTTRGYIRLDRLQRGDDILSYREGALLDDHATGRNANKAIKMISGVGNHPFARRRTIEGLEYTSHPLHRLVVEADMNLMKLEEFLWALHSDTTGLRFLAEDLEIHHKDHDRDNNTRQNLEPMTKEEHARLHQLEHSMNRYRYAPRLQKVRRIKRVGPMPTYDIQMKAPNHNFVANGLVVHNCGKSLTAKAIATAWEVPLLKIDLGALKSKFVGESEANLRRVFRVIEAIGRCVVWFDELEKALAGATSGAADGGVSGDALGAILSWMQERSGEAFVIATANDVTTLPPELLRKGRFDEVWWVDLPNRTERVEILAATLRQHKRDPEVVNLAEVAGVCDNFTGSEIAALVPEALFTAFADSKREVSTTDLIQAAATVTPLADTMSEKITKLREWATGRARPATSGSKIKERSESRRQLDL